MVNHHEVPVIFQDIEYQLQANIRHHFLQYNFSFFIITSLQKYLQSIQNYLLKAFATLPNHINYLHPNIQDIMIFIFVITFHIVVISFCI